MSGSWWRDGVISPPNRLDSIQLNLDRRGKKIRKGESARGGRDDGRGNADNANGHRDANDGSWPLPSGSLFFSQSIDRY